MTDDLAARWADLLVDYCLGVKPGETILIGSEMEAWPLIAACYKAVLVRGAHPLVRPDFPDLTEFFLTTRDRRAARPPAAELAARREARRRPDPDLGRGRHAGDARGSTRSGRRSSTGPAHPVRQAAREKRWVLTQYPTAGYAADARMSLERLRAIRRRRDVPRPARPGRGLAGTRATAGGARRVHDGREDRPDRGRGDRPDALGGRADLDQFRRPAEHALGRDLHGSGRGLAPRPAPVRVPRLPRRPASSSGSPWSSRAGKVVSARAEEGEDYLLSMLDLDPGARECSASWGSA